MKGTNILKKLNLEALPANEQEEMLLTLSDLVFKGTLVRLVSKMDESTKDAFGKLLEKDASPDEVAAFLKERVSGSEDAARETLADISSDFAAAGV